MKLYCIYSANEAATNSGAGFWSNYDGWTDLENASVFTESEKTRLNLPGSVGDDAIVADFSDFMPSLPKINITLLMEGGLVLETLCKSPEADRINLAIMDWDTDGASEQVHTAPDGTEVVLSVMSPTRDLSLGHLQILDFVDRTLFGQSPAINEAADQEQNNS